MNSIPIKQAVLQAVRMGADLVDRQQKLQELVEKDPAQRAIDSLRRRDAEYDLLREKNRLGKDSPLYKLREENFMKTHPPRVTLERSPNP